MRLRPIFVAWSLMFAGIVCAGPPFVTDDPDVPPVGGWEINIPFTLQRTPGTTDMQTPLFDLNYGLPNIQLEFDVPVAVVQDERRGIAAGLGDILLGIKWRFFEDKHSHVQLGTYPQVFAPTGDAKSGLGSGRPTYELPSQVPFETLSSTSSAYEFKKKAKCSRSPESLGTGLLCNQ